MSIENEFVFIGWNQEGSSDKIWGYFLRPTGTDTWSSKDWGWHCVRFWGRRGKAMQFKADVTGYELDKLREQKQDKGYVEINRNRLMEIWPTFIEEAEAKLMWDILSGKIV